jgi:hypothetical protein
MVRLGRTDYWDVWFSRLARPCSLSPPFNGEDFVLMLVVADSEITADERHAVSAELVRQGCRYAVCTGHECSRWDDSIDFAFIETSPDFTPPDERFVMTTWHEKDSIEDVVEFFRLNTTFNDFVTRHYLAIVLGGEAETESKVRLTVTKAFGAGE